MRRIFSLNAVTVIIVINIIVFAFWRSTDREQLLFMMNNFTISGAGLLEGRYWTLLTSVFSHNMFFHILLNMFVLRSFGSVMEYSLGVRRFLVLYLGAGLLGSLAHALVTIYVVGDPDLKAVGASGAIAGVILCFSCMYPKEKILLLGIIPLPAYFGAILFIGLDLWGLSVQAGGGGLPIGHGAHLGGALFGILYFWWVIRPRRRLRARLPY